jgi:hypothetical protein
MKKSIYKVITIVLFVSIALISYADTKTELRKTVSKEFDIDKYSSVEISNRYGRVEVRGWNQNKVKTDVTIIVKSNDKSVAQSKLDEITINLTKQSNTIIGVTTVNSENGWSWSLFGGSKVSYEINYIVYMPNNLMLTVENKYGNIMLPEMDNQVNINLKYGNLEACNISGALRLDMSYSNGIVGNIGDMTGVFSYSHFVGMSAKNVSIDAKYSQVIMDDATSVSALTKYSELKLGNIGAITLRADYDDFKIGDVSKGTFDMDYTDAKIKSISHTMTADISYGSLRIDNITSTAKSVRISSKYAPIDIHNSASANIEIKGSYMDAKVGPNIVTKSNVKNGSSVTLRGYQGKENAVASIVIDSKYGDVKIY